MSIIKKPKYIIKLYLVREEIDCSKVCKNNKVLNNHNFSVSYKYEGSINIKNFTSIINNVNL